MSKFDAVPLSVIGNPDSREEKFMYSDHVKSVRSIEG